MTEFHVDRDVSRRTTSEEGCYTADTQTFPNEGIRISLHKRKAINGLTTRATKNMVVTKRASKIP